METSETPKRKPGGRAEHEAVVLDGGADPRAHDHQRANEQQDGLEDDHAGHREARVRAMDSGEAKPEEHQPGGGERDADPLAAGDAQAERPLGHHGEQDDASGEHRLNDRQRCDRHRRDVEDPRAGGDHHAEREQLGGEQRPGGAQRVADIDRRGRARATVLVQEADVGRQGAGKRQHDAEHWSHEEESPGSESLVAACLTDLFGTRQGRLEHAWPGVHPDLDASRESSAASLRQTLSIATLIQRLCQPLLLLDIDGVISLFGFDARRPPPGRLSVGRWDTPFPFDRRG